MMSIADPVVSAGITRLPQPELELAAFGVAQPIAILMESPIIYMLGTGVALVRNRAMYQLVWRFMLHLSILMTVASALLFFTPAYHVMTRTLLGLTEDVAAAARPAMQLLLLWPAAIGLRRFLQGVLDQTWVHAPHHLGNGVSACHLDRNNGGRCLDRRSARRSAGRSGDVYSA